MLSTERDDGTTLVLEQWVEVIIVTYEMSTILAAYTYKYRHNAQRWPASDVNWESHRAFFQTTFLPQTNFQSIPTIFCQSVFLPKA
jgi:hypothetical protein